MRRSRVARRTIRRRSKVARRSRSARRPGKLVVKRRSRRVSRKRRTARTVNRRRNTRRLVRHIGGVYPVEVMDGDMGPHVYDPLAEAGSSLLKTTSPGGEAKWNLGDDWSKGDHFETQEETGERRMNAALTRLSTAFDQQQISDRKGEDAANMKSERVDDDSIIFHLNELKDKIDATKKQQDEWMRPLISVVHSASILYDIGANQLQGGKPTQEDSLVIDGQCGGDHCLMAIFDGHGNGVPQRQKRTPGQFASYICALNLRDLFIGARNETRRVPVGISAATVKREHIKMALNDTFDALLDECVTDLSKASMATVLNDNGTTAVVAYIEGNLLTVANVGDCRAVIGYEDGSAKQLSYEHVASVISSDHQSTEFLVTPRSESEQERISLIPAANITNDRLNGSIEVTRSIGDLSQPGITHIPDIYQLDLTHQHKILILGCDGLWESMTNIEAVTEVLKLFNEGYPAHEVTKLLIDKSVELLRGRSPGKRTDNITAIVVELTKPPPDSTPIISEPIQSQVMKSKPAPEPAHELLKITLVKGSPGFKFIDSSWPNSGNRTNKPIVTDIDEQSDAFKEGLKNGMKLVSYIFDRVAEQFKVAPTPIKWVPGTDPKKDLVTQFKRRKNAGPISLFFEPAAAAAAAAAKPYEK